jgi:hypothetical protein
MILTQITQKCFIGFNHLCDNGSPYPNSDRKIFVRCFVSSGVCLRVERNKYKTRLKRIGRFKKSLGDILKKVKNRAPGARHKSHYSHLAILI